jgi:hypothetical protein
MKSLIDGMYFLPCAYAVIVTLILVVDRARWRTSGTQGDWPAIIAFLAASSAYIVISRERILRFDLPLNPDEAQMAANAMRSRFGWLNWGMIDPVTSGPLNSAILAWPYLLGGDITLYATRLAGLFCVCGTVAFLLLTIRNLSDIRTAVIAMVPCVLLFGSTKSHDFVHYSSEHLPMFLLSLAIYLFARAFDRARLGPLLGSATVLGLVPLAKLQAAPIAAVVGIFVLARAAVAGSRTAAAKRVALVIVAALLPATVYLGPLALSGELEDLINSSIIQPQFRGPPAWGHHIPKMVLGSGVVTGLVIVVAAGLVAAATLILLARRRGSDVTASFSPLLRWSGILAFALFPTAYAVIAFTGREFAHYLLLAIPVLVLIGGVALSSIAQFPFARRWHGVLSLTALFAVALAVMLPAAFGEWSWGKFWVETADKAFLEGRMLEAPRGLAWLRPGANDSIVCWGWRPECYLDTAMRPATRDTTNENQYYDTPLRGYFRARFMRDFNSTNPDFVLDTAAPGSFTLNNPETDGLTVFPPFAEAVARDFALASRVDPPGRCPRLYVRRARLAELNKSLIAFSSIAASAAIEGHGAAALDDGSTFETCRDSWLLPERTLGSVTLRFRQPGPVRSFAILNVRKGHDGRRSGSDVIRLSVRSGDKVLAQHDLTLRPYPFWTFYRLDRAIEADAMAIDILSYRWLGGGLNEVKAYRD